MIKTLTVVSGGQTGVDRAALDSARAAGLEIGGWCPKGRRAEDGPIAAIYPLRETASADYAERTRRNVEDSDATLILAPSAALADGTRLTADFARAAGKALLVLVLPGAEAETARTWIAARGIRCLNVAGPRASKAPGIYRDARAFLAALFAAV